MIEVSLPRLLDSSMNEVTRLHPISLGIDQKIVPLSTAKMQLIPEESVPERSYVELFTVNGSAGIYRAKTPEIGYGDLSNTVNLEHAVCEVGDWIIPAEIEKEQKTLSQALTQVFGYYRGNKWQLGTVSVSGNVITGASYTNLLSQMIGLIGQVPSAMMTFDFTTSPWTINVVARGTTVTAEGRLSRNVQSAVVKKDISKLCTRVYVKGLGTNGAVGYADADTVSTYGIVENYLSGSDYTAEQAATVAAQYLAQHKYPRYSVDIGILDLSIITGESLDQIAVGKLFRLAIPDQNVTIEENIVSISWLDVINTPITARATLSAEEENITQFVSEQAGQISGIAASVSEIEEEIEEIDNDLITYQSEIQKLDNRIGLVVTATQHGDVINTASIVAAINGSASSVVISADHIDLHGQVSISDLEESYLDPQDRWSLAVAGTVGCYNLGATGNISCSGATIGGTFVTGSTVDIVVDGATYSVLLGSRYTPN